MASSKSWAFSASMWPTHVVSRAFRRASSTVTARTLASVRSARQRDLARAVLAPRASFCGRVDDRQAFLRGPDGIEQERAAREARKGVHRGLHPKRLLPTGRVREQVDRDVVGLALRPNAGPDGSPEVLHR